MKAKWNVLGFAGAEATWPMLYLAVILGRQTWGEMEGKEECGVRSRPDDVGLSFMFVPASL